MISIYILYFVPAASYTSRHTRFSFNTETMTNVDE